MCAGAIGQSASGIGRFLVDRHRVDRIAQSLIEEAALNQTHLLQIVFQQQVEVLRVRGFQVRVSLGELRHG